MTVYHWSRDTVMREICRLHEEGGDLRHGEVSTNHQKLVSAAVRYFGSWGAAVSAAGIDYADIRKRSQDARSAKVTKWSLVSIAQQIKALADNGESLCAATVRSRHPALFSAAVSSRYYGSWRSALTAVGIDYEAVLAQSRTSTGPTRDVRGMRTVVRRLHVLGSDMGNLTASQARSRYPRLYEKAVARFGSWESAVEAAFNGGNAKSRIQDIR